MEELEQNSRRKGIFEGLKDMIAVRQKESAFSPYAGQEVLELGPRLFGLVRSNQETSEQITFVVNLAAASTEATLPHSGVDVLSGKTVEGKVALRPYEFMWIK